MAKNTDILSPLRVGNKVLIRTVTHYHTGKITGVNEHEIVLTDAAWIADTGRFNEALRTGNLNEVEPFPGAVSVNRGAVIDVTDWTADLPRSVK